MSRGADERGLIRICHRTVDITCLLTALMFFMSNLLNIILRSNQYQGSAAGAETNYDSLLNLDTTYLSKQWQQRYQQRSLMTFTNLFNALGWFLLCIPLCEFSWIRSGGGRKRFSLHIGIAFLSIGGSMTELLSRLMTVGMYNVCLYLARDFNLDHWIGPDQSNDGIGWKTLEVVSMIANGVTVWMDAIEWLCLFFVMSLIYMSIHSDVQVHSSDDVEIFSKTWASMGLLIGVLSIFDFMADLMRMINWTTFGLVVMVISCINTLCLLPMWLLWLSVQLPRAKSDYYDRIHDQYHELNEETLNRTETDAMVTDAIRRHINELELTSSPRAGSSRHLHASVATAVVDSGDFDNNFHRSQQSPGVSKDYRYSYM